MIRINNIKLKIGYTADDIEAVIKKNLKLSYVPAYKIAKLSIDSRKKDQDRKSTRLNSSHKVQSRMPSSA